MFKTGDLEVSEHHKIEFPACIMKVFGFEERFHETSHF